MSAVNTVTFDSCCEQGVWVVEDDLEPRGGFEDIPATRAVYGLRISPTVFDALHAHAAALRALDALRGVNVRPLSLYHGTDAAAAVALLQTQAPIETLGMLGVGFYAASFFKACRFAGRTQDYVLRRQGEGAVLRVRVLARPEDVCEAHDKQAPCACADCGARIAHHAAYARVARLVDHETTWRKRAGVRGVHLGVGPHTRLSAHRGEFGGHYVSRHDEWCFPAELVVCCDAALLDMKSIDLTRYNPLERTQAIV